MSDYPAPPPPPSGPPGGNYGQPGGGYGQSGDYGQSGGFGQQSGSYPPHEGGGYGGQGGPPAHYNGPSGPPAAFGYGGFQLPPGVELATAGRRVGAYFLSIPLVIVTLYIGYFIWGAVVWGRGTSPALGVLGLRCIDANTGRPVGWGTMALRNIVGGFVQALFGVMLLVSFIMFLSDDRHRSIPDRIGSTLVVHDPNRVLG